MSYRPVNPYVQAFQHPIRLSIINLLRARGPMSPKELGIAIDTPIENMSYHVRELKNVGLLKVTRTQQVRGAVQTFYKLDEQQVAEAASALRSLAESLTMRYTYA